MEATLTESTSQDLYRIDERGIIRKSDRYAEIVDAKLRTHIVECGGCGREYPVAELFSHDCVGGTSMQARPADLVPADTPDWTRPQGNGSGHRQSVPPSDAQMGLIRKLLAEAGAEHTDQVDFEGLTGGRNGTASALIDRLLREAKHRRAHQAEREQVRRNRYAGTCDLCGQHVPANEGQLLRTDAGWNVRCAGGCKARSTAQTAVSQPDVPAGHYAIGSTGHNDLAFYRVDRPERGSYAGRVFVKLIVGGHPDRNVPRSHVTGILARIAEDPSAAARRYGTELGRCSACNKTLTDETSRQVGIGPECRKRSA